MSEPVWVRLTSGYYSGPCWVRADRIVAIQPLDNGGSMVNCKRSPDMSVRESPDDVHAAIVAASPRRQ